MLNLVADNFDFARVGGWRLGSVVLYIPIAVSNKLEFLAHPDQAGKQRRQLMDALGRVVRVDEPYTNGALGTLASPAQPTYYEYDANDNLAKVLGTQRLVTVPRE